MLTKLNRDGTFIHALMSGAPFKAGAYFEDSRVKDLPSTAQLTQKLRQRCYSILFFEKPRKSRLDLHVNEWFTAGPNSLDQAVVQRIDKPPDCHPGLEALWNPNSRTSNKLR